MTVVQELLAGVQAEVEAELGRWLPPESEDPTRLFEALRHHLAFFPGRVDACTVRDELVRPQPGDYYGGWITRDVVGPFKGPPGTEGW